MENENIQETSQEAIETIEAGEEILLENEAVVEVSPENDFPVEESSQDDGVEDSGQADAVIIQDGGFFDGTIYPDENSVSKWDNVSSVMEGEEGEENEAFTSVSSNDVVGSSGAIGFSGGDFGENIIPMGEQVTNNYYYTAAVEEDKLFFESNISEFTRLEIMVFFILLILLTWFIHFVFRGSRWFKG